MERFDCFTLKTTQEGKVLLDDAARRFFNDSTCPESITGQLHGLSSPVVLHCPSGLLVFACPSAAPEDELAWMCEPVRPWYQQSSEEIAIIDQTGRILDANAAWEHQFPDSRDRRAADLLNEDIPYSDVLSRSCRTLPLSNRQYRELLIIPLDHPGAWYTLLIPSVRPDAIRLDQFHYQLFERSLFPIAILDTHEIIQDVNLEFTGLFKYSRKELIGKPINKFIIPEARREESLRFIQAIREQNTMMKKTQRMAKDGTVIDVEAVGSPIIQDGRVIGMFAMYKDISREVQHLKELKKQKAYFQQLFDNSPDAIALVDEEDQVVTINRSFSSLFGYSLDEIQGKPINGFIVTPQLRDEASSYSRFVIQQQQYLHVESKRLTRSRDMVDMEIMAFPIYVQKDHLGAYALYRDISDRKQKEQEIQRLIYTDQLTGLNNRLYCYERLSLYITRETPFVLLYCDLDLFKEINDLWGHSVGDELLQAIGSRLGSTLSQLFDIARLGGDEFALFTTDTAQSIDAAILALRDVFSKPFMISKGDTAIGLSIGSARFPDDGSDVDDLLKCADLAMYREKRSHRSMTSAKQET